MQADLPPWLSQNAVVYHRPSCTLFIAYQCRRDRATNQLILLNAPKGISGAQYPVAECELAQPHHFTGVALISVQGKPVTAIPIDGGLLLSNGQRSLKVIIPGELNDPTYEAALSLARAFDGELVAYEAEAVNEVTL